MAFGESQPITIVDGLFGVDRRENQTIQLSRKSMVLNYSDIAQMPFPTSNSQSDGSLH
jgi:hypothetical protein